MEQADASRRDASALRDTWHRFTGPNANEPPRALVAAIIPGRGDAPGHLVLAQRPVEKAELLRHANLIAAAPDLLSALRNITECAEAGTDGANMDLWIQQAHAAIAKATQPSAPAGEANPTSESGA